MAFLEEIIHDDAHFPLIFHTDKINNRQLCDLVHWHRKLEILCSLEGAGVALIDGEPIPMTPGDIIVIAPGRLHVCQATEEICRYHCLIIDQDFLTDQGLWDENALLPTRLRDEKGQALFDLIAEEMAHRSLCYKQMVLSLAAQLLVGLHRRHQMNSTAPTTTPKGGHIETVRRAIAILEREFSLSVSLDRLCQAVGLSKYYFCRAFKQTTGRTVNGYLNHVRCDRAHRLLTSGQCNVSEAAEQCGFRNLSYFTKVYRRHYGHPPSLEKRSVRR